ncbi:MAG TPA: ABC-ATPase domain-containing protein [Longimicrobiales bacterium]|nr:ABC-ATPase domain-containing protein [Longimicrobiales bacterium]
MPTTEKPTLETLRGMLVALEGQGYSRYKEIKGGYLAADLELLVDYVQGDPFARPSRVRVLVPNHVAKLPEWACDDPVRRRAAADFVHRVTYGILTQTPRVRGSGRSGDLDVLRPGQQVLERTALILDEAGDVELRMGVGLPADGRRILGAEAAGLLCETVPDALRRAMNEVAASVAALRRHVQTVADADALRTQLSGRGLVAFVADGSLLPRSSGIDDSPLRADRARALRAAPDGLAVTLSAPNAGLLRGMGIPAGVTLIVGGGYHGKSTLLRALERGVYDHVPGDGRERVVTVRGAVKVRSEDGRSVAGTDISNFIGELPGGERPERFHSASASGSTSQAAAIMEALEVGAECLLLDEDTSAANFMIRDARMQRLIAARDEPITAFVDRAGELHRQQGVSTVMVVGGSGDYFDVADTVIAMTDYQPRDVAAEARAIARELPTSRTREGRPWHAPARRGVLPESVDPRDGRGRIQVRLHSGRRVLLGAQEIDLSGIEQVVEPAQLRAMAWALIRGLGGRLLPNTDVAEALTAIMREIETAGLAVIHPEPVGDLAAFRIHELAAFLGRIRTLEIRDLAGTRVAPSARAQDD